MEPGQQAGAGPGPGRLPLPWARDLRAGLTSPGLPMEPQGGSFPALTPQPSEEEPSLCPGAPGRGGH